MNSQPVHAYAQLPPDVDLESAKPAEPELAPEGASADGKAVHLSPAAPTPPSSDAKLPKPGSPAAREALAEAVRKQWIAADILIAVFLACHIALLLIWTNPITIVLLCTASIVMATHCVLRLGYGANTAKALDVWMVLCLQILIWVGTALFFVVISLNAQLESGTTPSNQWAAWALYQLPLFGMSSGACIIVVHVLKEVSSRVEADPEAFGQRMRLAAERRVEEARQRAKQVPIKRLARLEAEELQAIKESALAEVNGSAEMAIRAEAKWTEAAAKLKLFRTSPEQFEEKYGVRELSRLDGP